MKNIYRTIYLIFFGMFLASCSATSFDQGIGAAGGTGSTGGGTTGNPANGVATVRWNAPSENTDNSGLTDLAGYKIYYGEQSGSLISSIRIDDPAANSYMVQNLNNGSTYYFAVTAFNSHEIESPYSQIVAKNIN